MKNTVIDQVNINITKSRLNWVRVQERYNICWLDDTTKGPYRTITITNKKYILLIVYLLVLLNNQ